MTETPPTPPRRRVRAVLVAALAAAVVALNSGKSFARLEVPANGFAVDGAVFQSVWGADDARVDNGILHGVAVPPRSGVALIGVA